MNECPNCKFILSCNEELYAKIAWMIETVRQYNPGIISREDLPRYIAAYLETFLPYDARKLIMFAEKVRKVRDEE